MRYILILLFVSVIVGCNTVPIQPTTAMLGQLFKLKLGQTATLDDGLIVTFQDVPTDGRCSSCTASFYAAIALQMTVPGKPPVRIVVNTPPHSSIEGDTTPYTIQFIRLEPQHNYPNDFLNRAAYTVSLVITKEN